MNNDKPGSKPRSKGDKESDNKEKARQGNLSLSYSDTL
jgi:hypothetical protein